MRLSRIVLMAAGCLALAPADSFAATQDRAEAIAHDILDTTRNQIDREGLIRDHPELSAGLIRAMAADVKSDSKEEYRRIPWIWRVAIAAGKRNDGPEILRILEVALPRQDQPLADWQAVVIGGGLINGISQAGAWPGERIRGLLKDQAGLLVRWERAIELASAMADNESVPTGTRYDALRMLGVGSWDKQGAHLFRYLARGVHSELQQGALSSLADVPGPVVGQALLSGWEHYSPRNRQILLDALLRDDARKAALLDALAAGRINKTDFNPEFIRRLLDSLSGDLRSKAENMLGKPS